tara:strand:- start:229 stop:564 length:336 start_codon:yes stop_codon:yes gene_type:complete
MRSKLYIIYLLDYVFCFSKYNKHLSTKFISKRVARPFLLDLQNNSCLMCLEEFSDNVPCEIHHIDKNSSNNVFDNYVALCCNCHSSIHRYNKTFPIEKYKKVLYNKTSLFT